MKKQFEKFKEFRQNLKKKSEDKKARPPKPKEKKEIHNDFLKFLIYRFSDFKEYKERRLKFANDAIPLLIEGCGGAKNIVSIKAYRLAIKIQFKSHYQLREEVLKKAGGLHLWIGEHELIEVFDHLEVKHIFTGIKKELKKSKSSLIQLNLA